MATTGVNVDRFPRVVRIRRSRGQVVQGCDVYIGDAVHRGGWELEDSEWRNPYVYDTTKDYELDLQRYEMYLRHQRPDLMARLPELYGKILGCWCKPGPCHGDVLVYLVKEHIAANTTDYVTHNASAGTRTVGTQTYQMDTCGYKRPVSDDDQIACCKVTKSASV